MKQFSLTVIATVLFTLFMVISVYANTIFHDDFDTNIAGWDLGPEWDIGFAMTSTGNYFGNPDPPTDVSPSTDNGVAGVVIGGNAYTGLHDFFYLTSPVVDTSHYIDVNFGFYRWLNSDYTPYMKNIIEVFDGVEWQEVWSSGETAIKDQSWEKYSYDVSAYVNDSFQVRFGHMVGSFGVHHVSSWNIDEFMVEGTPVPVPEPATLLLVGVSLAGLACIRRKLKHLVRKVAI